MADLVLPADGEDIDVWGPILNTALTALNTDKVEISARPTNARDYGVTGDGSDQSVELTAAFEAAEAAGGRGVLELPNGTIGVGAGFSLAGYSSAPVGQGANHEAGAGQPKGTVIYAAAQDGPVLDFTDWVQPGGFRGRVKIGSFAVRGSNAADATKVNVGMLIPYVGSVTFEDIVVSQTGGPCLALFPITAGYATYLCDFNRLTLVNPVSAKANDVPYLHARGSNGNRFLGMGLRSMGMAADVGVSGAVLVEDDGTYAPSYNLFHGCWAENLHVPTGGAFVHIKANNQVLSDWQWFDCFKEAGATGTAYIRLSPPSVNDLGANIVRGGVIPGDNNAPTTAPDTGVDLLQSRNVIDGVKGYRGKNVTLAAGVGGTSAILRGGQSTADTAAFVDNSGLSTNTLIDEYTGYQKLRGYQSEPRTSGQGGAGPRFFDPADATRGTVHLGNGLARITGVVAAMTAYTDSLTVVPVNAGPATLVYGAGGARDMAGAGAPESQIAGPVGSTYRRTDGGAGTSLYVKESGTGATGWVNVKRNEQVMDLRDASGVVGDGVTNDSAAINTAAAEAAASGLRLFAQGTFRIDTTVTITGACDLTDAVFEYYGSGTALIVEPPGADLSLDSKTIDLPSVTYVPKPGTGWDSSTVGVKLVNLFACQVNIPFIEDFETGLYVYGDDYGISYNTVYVGQLANNKRNLVLGATTAGWANQNTFIGGRFQHYSGEGANVAGTRHILLKSGSTSVVNGNVFVGCSLESPGVVQFTVDIEAGAYNRFVGCRYEFTAGNGKIYFGSVGACSYNTIDGGYGAQSIVATYNPTAFGNEIRSPGKTMRQLNTTSGDVIENIGSSAYPVMTILAAGGTANGVDPLTAYTSRIASSDIKLKTAGATIPYVHLDGVSGHITQIGYHELLEMTAPGAPATNRARLFLQDNGSGKTQLCARFPTGAVQILSTEARNTASELVFNVKDYGALGDGVTDDTTAIRACLAATRGGTTAGVSGGTIFFPPGKYVITDTIEFRRFSGIVRGAGLGNPPTWTTNPGSGTVIKWEGTAGIPMFLLREHRQVKIADLRYEGKTSAMPSFAIESRYLLGEDIATGGKLVIDNVHIGFWPWTADTLLAAGIGFTGDNFNNDKWHISNTYINGCAVGIDLPNSQSVWGMISNTYIQSASTAGVRSAAAFTGTNLNFWGCAIDMLLTSSANYNVYGWWSEGSALICHLSHTGTLNVHGGKWYLQDGYMTGGVLFKHDLLTSGAAVNLYGIEVSTTVTSHPKIQLRGAGGGTKGSDFRMVGCQPVAGPGMTMAEFDVTNTNNAAGMRVLIDSFGIYHRELLTNGETLGVIPWHEVGNLVQSGYQELLEIADPAAPAANRSRMFTRDNGSGKTQVCVRFPTGAIQVLSTEP